MSFCQKHNILSFLLSVLKKYVLSTSCLFCLYVILSKNNYVILSKSTIFAVIMAVFILEIIV